ncbi:hypothetical protein Q5M87_10740 [Brachyspira innocens]|uniref:Cell surface protein n=1 Tax=Brachyspira innocens TaxID=13264 RepID=A0ABT8Z245_9SPIR|nr:hypothetical protein [Brachyspira innocens]MDO6994483.1 hypothetical protein [Brachyspira innocens]MDO7021604.1 hypothetical protein [Brachyspira innocens]
MKKVSKKTKFLAVVLGSLMISSSAFAVDLTIDNSAVKRATAGQFSTDSDKVKAKDIFDLERSFFSAGYLGQTSRAINGGGNGTATAAGLKNGVQGAFGVALPGGMYLGFAAAYNLKDTANYTADKDGNINNGNKWNVTSTGNFILAFRINEMVALHYNLKIGNPNMANPTVTYKIDHTVDKNSQTDYKTYTHNAYWNHEIAAAIKFGEHKLTVPISVDIYANNTKQKGKSGNTDVDYANYTGEDYVKLNLNPEFFLSLPMGPMTGINMGVKFGVGLNNNVGRNGKDGISEYKATQKALRMNVGAWASFPMEWSLANDQVSLAMEPQINLDFNVNKFGKMEQSIAGAAQPVTDYGRDSFVFSPSIELPIGTLWRPVEWYELRFGTALILGADIAIDQAKDANGKTDKTTGYGTYSGIAGFFGMGFIVGEDFNIDLFAEVGTLSFINMNFGGQLTYRFN